METDFTTKRDKCWLSQKITSGFPTFSINDFSGRKSKLIHQTICSELSRLFPNSKESKTEDPALQFAKTEDDLNEGFCILRSEDGKIKILASEEIGYLHGLFALYEILAGGRNVSFPYVSVPDQSIRMLNHWDNFDGSIERGYAGNSIFYNNNEFRNDFDLLTQYARLLCSVGINAVSINNVNVHHLEAFFIEKPALSDIKNIADIFSSYGIRLFLSINFAAPIIVGKLHTADPCDPDVRKWWSGIVDSIYEEIPDFGGFLVKADSEGEPGPFTYNRTHADGANMLAKAIAPHDGIIIWRCFVYNCQQSWKDRSLDRANAAYDLFITLDGQFEDNVILQIKNGPIDFQIREPVSPLFGALHKTNQILEFEITQEYTGHQIDQCYLLPMWKEVMDFDTRYEGESLVKDIVREYSPVTKNSGIAAVVNVGMDENWTGNKMAQANLFGYGLMCWDNTLSSEEIARRWVNLSFVLDNEDTDEMVNMLMTSRKTYENYTCPLGVGFMCRPNIHYGVDVDGYEYDRWGTYHYSDRNGIGRERSLSSGTGYTRRYSDSRFLEYENLNSCPDELLLFMHHVPYDHVLHSGKTVIQHIYDSHFEGVEAVEHYIEFIKRLKGKISDSDYSNILERAERQLTSAIEWRDTINTYFYRKSGIEDSKHRKIYE
ncbi:alpha-glucuronidase [Oribacterium sp. WCC10]|uniref:alpha-glucuronidase n=1 Tax=Oribacterium sp. WCC10 TaxID=1855343 RepID=UPI0008E0A78C|nr:alpha-glucuronidase [Oribacterium sp. WCC10]SFG20571.1 alpha-glucuronidase [Oribacterium sp. WCC10]